MTGRFNVLVTSLNSFKAVGSTILKEKKKSSLLKTKCPTLQAGRTPGGNLVLVDVLSL